MKVITNGNLKMRDKIESVKEFRERRNKKLLEEFRKSGNPNFIDWLNKREEKRPLKEISKDMQKINNRKVDLHTIEEWAKNESQDDKNK